MSFSRVVCALYTGLHHRCREFTMLVNTYAEMHTH